MFLARLQHSVRSGHDPPTLPVSLQYLAALDEPEEFVNDGDSSSSDDDARTVVEPQEEAEADTSDFEPEVSLDTYVHIRVTPSQNLVRPHATGLKQPPYELLDAMSSEDGRDRLIFVDYVYPSYRKRLKAGVTVFLIVMDYKTDYVMFRPLVTKDTTADAFAHIGTMRGWHKLAHVVHCVSDGEPILHSQIGIACDRLLMTHTTSVPNRPQTNRAGSNITRNLRRIADCLLLDASAHGRNLDGSHEAIAWGCAVDIHNIMANKKDLTNRSPFELTFEMKPSYTLAPFGTPGYMTISSAAKRAHIARGGRPGAHRMEPILWIGQRDGHHRVLTTRGSGRSGPVHLDLSAPLGVFPGEAPRIETVKPAGPVKSQPAASRTQNATLEEATLNLMTSADAACHIVAGAKRSSTAYIQERCDALIGCTIAEALKRSFPNAEGKLVSYRRTDLDYDIKCHRLIVEVIPNDVTGAITAEEAAELHCAVMLALEEAVPSEIYFLSEAKQAEHANTFAEIVAQKNLSWKTYIAPGSKYKEEAEDAWHKENTGITEMGVWREAVPGTAEYDAALKEATPCRPLLDRKRSGLMKCRIVERGDLEDTDKTDGPDFSYYAGVASQTAIRLTLMQSGRYALEPGETEADRIELSTVDVSLAFCQSHAYDDGRPRYLKVKSPLDGVTRYYVQLKPLYGARSAPARWQKTFAEWAVTPIADGGPGLIRGKNEPSIFSRRRTGSHGALLLCLYVDDILLSGKKVDQLEFYRLLNVRFDCKDVQWLTTGVTLDHLGLEVHQCELYTWITMTKYIKNMQVILNMEGCAPMSVPFTKNITDLKQISDVKKIWFATALGQCGWLSSTIRLDGKFAHSRIGQHSADPCQGAYDALVELVRYYVTTANLGIRQSLYERAEFAFYCDSDLGSNPEPQNKRRSQLGSIGLIGRAPVIFGASTTTVRFGDAALPTGFRSPLPPVTAHSAIKEEHVAQSSTEAELYALALFANMILALSYVVEEANIKFPRPAVVNVDNTGCIAFARQNNHSGKSRLGHIDRRQQWLEVLRDSGLITCIHVDTENNIADIFTKILDKQTFERLRNLVMFACPY